MGIAIVTFVIGVLVGALGFWTWNSLRGHRHTKTHNFDLGTGHEKMQSGELPSSSVGPSESENREAPLWILTDDLR